MRAFEWNNQDMGRYLAVNESKMLTEEFFTKLEEDAKLDPKNMQIRDLWIRDGIWCGQYKVVFGRHFGLRIWQRFGITDPTGLIMRQLSNNEVAKRVTSFPVYWNNDQIVCDTMTRGVAIIQEDCPFVVIYEAGDSYIYPKTVVEKGCYLYCHPDTMVICIDENGRITSEK